MGWKNIFAIGDITNIPVIIISGETGCGKTTQLPRYVLESEIEFGHGAFYSIICTQHQRIPTMVVSDIFCREGSLLVKHIGLKDREEGDLGPVYGFQWRHFGTRYTDMHADYAGQGFDQLLDVIDKIKNNPNDWRIILSAWNPSDLKLMALPPCHMFAQILFQVILSM